MILCSSVTLAKLECNPFKTETSKLSLGIIFSEVFVLFCNRKILLGLLDTKVVLDLSTFSTVSYLFLMEVNYAFNMSPLFLMEVMDAQYYSTLSTFDSAVSSLDSDVSLSSLTIYT